MPTLDEINAAAPEVPVFILHLYGRALLNRAALNVLGIDKPTPRTRQAARSSAMRNGTTHRVC